MGRVSSALSRAAGQPPSDTVTSEAQPAAEAPASAGAAELSRPAERALLAHVNPNLAQKIVADDRINPASREQYRRLAAALHQGNAATGLSVIMVASAVAGEGKTLTASNLALTLSGSYQQRVLLIDADLRRPSLHTVFNTPRSPGLTDALISAAGGGSPVQVISPHLSLLPAGDLRVDPIAGLTSARMRHIVDSARATYSWVIIDTPPVGMLTDASLLASMVDGAVFVIKAEATPYDLIKRAVDALGREKVLGIVLNRALLHAHRYSYGYGDYQNYLAPRAADSESSTGQ